MADSKLKDGNWFKRHKVLSVVLGLFVFFVLVGALGGEPEAEKASTADKADATAPVAAVETPKESEPAVPVEYKSALAKADSYANMQHMSKAGLYDQLTSEYGEKFTPEAAQYAVDNVKTDWNKNALAKAKSYQEMQHMSPAGVRDQLVSPYGEKFTEAEADYAIANLDK